MLPSFPKFGAEMIRRTPASLWSGGSWKTAGSLGTGIVVPATSLLPGAREFWEGEPARVISREAVKHGRASGCALLVLDRVVCVVG